MSEEVCVIYVIVGWYSGGGAPTVDFAETADEAIKITAEKAATGQQVTVYKVEEDGSSLVRGKELRTRTD